MPPSLSLLFLVSSVWVALSSSSLMAAADGQGGEDCPPVLCGNVTISFPFGLIPEEATKTSCSGPGFQVRCDNSNPYLGYSRREQWFQILEIFYDNASLLVADVHKLQRLNLSGPEGCHVPANSTPTPAHIGLPFSISPANHDLVFYNCTKAPAPAVAAAEGLVETRCRNNTFARIGGRYDDDESSSYGRYFLEGCDAAVVPVLGRSGSGRTNASGYEELIGEGFLLTWQMPSLTPSAGARLDRGEDAMDLDCQVSKEMETTVRSGAGRQGGWGDPEAGGQSWSTSKTWLGRKRDIKSSDGGVGFGLGLHRCGSL